MRPDKRGQIGSDMPPIFVRLNIRTESWLKNCEHLESTYPRVLGSAARLQEFCEKLKLSRVVGITAARQAFG